MKRFIQHTFALFLMTLPLNSSAQTYYMPGEDLEHEGTWLQWPHNNLYGPYYQGDVEAGWVTMTELLQAGENVHLIASDNAHKNHIIDLLTSASVPMTNIDFSIFPTDDVWVRDNGPIYVYDENDNLTILDWGFNGWGNDTPFSLCDVIPASVSSATGIPRIDLSAVVLEGGAIEHDGNGTMMATRSSITHSSRNPGLSEAQIEDYLTTYMGFTNFIWLDGIYGQDITDQHIDGFVKFANDSTIVTMNAADLDYWAVTASEINLIQNAVNANSVPYNIVTVPLTLNNVITGNGTNLGYKGSYCNYYIGNDVVIVPIYGDPNDAVAIGILQSIYPTRTVVGMNVQNLYEYGGMTHCVTQQQPIALNAASLNDTKILNNTIEQNFPNPFSDHTEIRFSCDEQSIVELLIFNMQGKIIQRIDKSSYSAGDNSIKLNARSFQNGMYYYQFYINSIPQETKKMIIKK